MTTSSPFCETSSPSPAWTATSRPSASASARRCENWASTRFMSTATAASWAASAAGRRSCSTTATSTRWASATRRSGRGTPSRARSRTAFSTRVARWTKKAARPAWSTAWPSPAIWGYWTATPSTIWATSRNGATASAARRSSSGRASAPTSWLSASRPR